MKTKEDEAIYNPLYTYIKCPNCNGYGSFSYGRIKCPSCNGKGVLKIEVEEVKNG